MPHERLSRRQCRWLRGFTSHKTWERRRSASLASAVSQHPGTLRASGPSDRPIPSTQTVGSRETGQPGAPNGRLRACSCLRYARIQSDGNCPTTAHESQEGEAIAEAGHLSLPSTSSVQRSSRHTNRISRGDLLKKGVKILYSCIERFAHKAMMVVAQSSPITLASSANTLEEWPQRGGGQPRNQNRSKMVYLFQDRCAGGFICRLSV